MSHTTEPTIYRTIADADDYFSGLLYTTDWTGASSADKEKALLVATRAIDALRFTGYKHPVAALLAADPSATDEEIAAAEATQVRQWPREAVLENEQWQLTINASTGTFELVLNGEVTAAINFDDTAATIQAALEALASVSVGDVSVTVSTGGTDGVGPYDIVDSATEANTLVANDIDLGGSGGLTPVAVVVHVDNTPDQIFYAVCEEARSILSGRDPDQEFRNIPLTSDGIGSNRVNIDTSQLPPQHTANMITSPLAWKYLKPYLASKNSFDITRTS